MGECRTLDPTPPAGYSASITVQPPETDLILPLPGPDDEWDPHTLHTHYFGFCVPEAELGAFVYVRYLPYFPLCQGGVLIYRGMESLYPTDMAYQDYEITMPWPHIDGNAITTPNGLRIEFPEPGRRATLAYRSPDGRTSIEIEADAVTPLAARGHVIPGEDLHTSQDPGGSEQFMRYTGEVLVEGERHAVDCYGARDRSWRQVRTERRDGNLHPPVHWTPFCFGEDLAFNQAGFESPDADPLWAGAYEVPDGKPTHYFAWVSVDGQVREVPRVHVDVTEYHPLLFFPLRLEIEAEDEAGDTYAFSGTAFAFTPMPQWPNLTANDSMFRWTDAEGRVAHGTVQSGFNQECAHAMMRSRTALLPEALS